MRKGLLIELLGPVVTSASPATSARARALPYIPSAMMLGVAASVAVRQNTTAGEDVLNLITSGRICFDDGLPVSNAQVALPVPMSVFQLKGSDGHLRCNKGIVDLAGDPTLRQPGYTQMRNMAVLPGGEQVTIHTENTLRTAIDPGTGRAADSQFYGLEALSAGQVFLASFECDDAAVALKLEGYLTGCHFIGRSKSAEYGEVQISPCEPWDLKLENPAKGDRYVWFLADFWAQDGNGFPTLCPDAASLGCSGKVDWQRSFTRTRSFAPFNATWRARDVERTLITRGSVLTLEESDLTPGLHRFGLGQELGYGRALVSAMPPRQTLLELLIFPGAYAMPVNPESANPGETDLSQWLARAAEAEGIKREVAKDITVRTDALMAHYKAAKSLAGKPVGPKPSQWGMLQSRMLRGDAVETVTKADEARESDRWGARFNEGDDATFRRYVQALERDPELLARLAKSIRLKLEIKGWFDE